MAGLRAIEIVCNPFTAVEIARKQRGFDDRFMDQVRMPADMRGGITMERYAAIMDEADVEHSLLTAARATAANAPQAKSANCSAAVGFPDAEWGERLHAFAAPKPGRHPSETEIVSLRRRELSACKIPRGVTITEELPRDTSGKILKRELRDWAKAGLRDAG